MSGFIENPFADPFADPAINQVTSAPAASITTTAAAPVNTPTVNTTNSTNNNNNDSINFKQAASSTTGSATIVTTTAMPPTSTTINMDTKQMQNELERRQQELEIKAAELAAREEALRSTGDFRRQHNWPPLPSFCPVKPCFFQDINVDIQPEFQKTVQLGYNLWIAFIFVLLMNMIGSIAARAQSENHSEISFSIIGFMIFVPLSYVVWFRPLYKAFKNDSSFNFMVFFMCFFMQTFMTGFWSLGLYSTCGLFVAIGSVGNGGVLLTMFLFLVTGCWIAYVVASTLYLLRVHSIYRSSGASIAKAQEEFAKGIYRNPYVQQTIANAARQTVNQTFANATGNSAANQTSPDVRY